jgi:hypothetical protein
MKRYLYLIDWNGFSPIDKVMYPVYQNLKEIPPINKAMCLIDWNSFLPITKAHPY